MIDYSEYLEGYRDAQAYDVEEGGVDADYPLTLALARELGGPLLDLACGTGTMAIRMAQPGFQVTGVDIIPEMIAWASQKAQTHGVSIDWVVADARTFHLRFVRSSRLFDQALHGNPPFANVTERRRVLAVEG